jgi:hypothetical protein
LHNLALFWAKNADFFAKFFGENIFKIITSVPGLLRGRMKTHFHFFLLRPQLGKFGQLCVKNTLSEIWSLWHVVHWRSKWYFQVIVPSEIWSILHVVHWRLCSSVYGLFLALLDPWLKSKRGRYSVHSNEEVNNRGQLLTTWVCPQGRTLFTRGNVHPILQSPGVNTIFTVYVEESRGKQRIFTPRGQLRTP